MHDPVSILKKYWGYDNFRPLQEDIIRCILDGRDTLALLPTGGGKSICFQVPALCKDGICIVISPLISLMQDQVENLKRRNIPAVAVTSSMSKKEMDIAFDNCIYGKTKFLYLSPERLTTELARVRIARMNVNLFAVDEAHCISQWGYDFRPPYLEIANIRELHKKVPVLALTATATVRVADDIQEKLHFTKKNIQKKSFARENLAYIVRKTDDKNGQLLKIAQRSPGSGVVYVRNRRKTQDIALLLQQNDVTSTFYHAGLSPKERAERQQQWLSGTKKVIVATNAFGMGIDKPDVRFVAHLDLPDSPEAYFQEAGRAGRDGAEAAAVALWNNRDLDELQRNFEASFPSLAEIRRTYQALANFYSVPVGAGQGMTVIFDQQKLCSTYKLEPLLVFNSLKFLEKEGYIAVSDAVYQPSRVKILVGNEALYQFEVANPFYETFLKTILRMYSGVFDDFVRIREKDIAKRIGKNEGEVLKIFSRLEQMNILDYLPQNDRPLITFLTPRQDAKTLHISPEHLAQRKKQVQERIIAMKNFVTEDERCRQSVLLQYFGEEDTADCGKCDVCKRKTAKAKKINREETAKKITELLHISPKKMEDLHASLAGITEKEIMHVVRQMLDAGRIRFTGNHRLEIAQ